MRTVAAASLGRPLLDAELSHFHGGFKDGCIPYPFEELPTSPFPETPQVYQ